jgi:hypothetical protein
MSYLGICQADELASYLVEKPLDGPEAPHIKILRADDGSPPSKIVSSNLRRAVSTLAIGLRQRLARRPDEKILIVNHLQEISRNPDTLSITPPHTPIQASFIEKALDLCDFQSIYDTQVDMSLHNGNKPLNTTGMKRMLEFCDFIYSDHVREDHVIVGGHSIWFRYFFNMFLPFSVHHVSKNKKIVNGGVVTFDLMRADTKRGPKYMIDPKTIKVVYGGF